MARLLGIRAHDVTPFARWLLSSPGRLANLLANVEPEGWGVAVYGAPSEWSSVRRGFGAAAPDTFASISPRLRGTVLVAHLRSRADLTTSSATTQPIRRGDWALACDGRLDDLDFVRRAIAPERLRECSESSHAELLLAFLMSHLDAAHEADTDRAISTAVTSFRSHRAGSMTFVLSNGRVLYGHNGGPPLHIVEEMAGAREVVIASEPLSDEPWRALDDASLVRVGPDLVFLLGEDPRTRWDDRDVELPFTD